MTKAEKAHLSPVAALGCIVCRNLQLGESPAEIHHVRSEQVSAPITFTQFLFAHFTTARAATALLCTLDARPGKKRYGSEQGLLAQINAELGGTSA